MSPVCLETACRLPSSVDTNKSDSGRVTDLTPPTWGGEEEEVRGNRWEGVTVSCAFRPDHSATVRAGVRVSRGVCQGRFDSNDCSVFLIVQDILIPSVFLTAPLFAHQKEASTQARPRHPQTTVKKGHGSAQRGSQGSINFRQPIWTKVLSYHGNFTGARNRRRGAAGCHLQSTRPRRRRRKKNKLS